MYLDTKVNLANSTLNNYKNMYEVNIKNSLLGNMQICSVKKSDILKFYKHLYIDKKLSVGTIQLYQNLLYPAFQLAVDDSTIRLNPCKNCMKEYVRGSMDSPRIALTKEQQKKLLSFVKNNNIYKRYYTMFATVLCTGLRISEAMGLTWNNIDFKNHYITIDHQILYRKKMVQSSIMLQYLRIKRLDIFLCKKILKSSYKNTKMKHILLAYLQISILMDTPILYF